MKRLVIFISLLTVIVSIRVVARNPVGYYYVKFVLYNNNGKTDVSKSERTLYLENNKLTALNTLQGQKYWEVEYQGLVKLGRYGNFEFHKYYLVNKNVYCYFSDERMIEGKDGKIYYLIEFDGQAQLADR